ncbi:FRG domain-containing protein [Chryseobacterium indologenes]|uniref:FRG domain-containing protein n=1 Tax=Chryseobacterium indologenes TaxID=253 RepID=UPI0009A1C45E|nr:FRG domain-containing protein [Chryseobacterium indologenes]
MKLEEYKTFEDKKYFFKDGDLKLDKDVQKIFDTIKAFQEIGDGFIYRGCGEAKYKLYNSAQRMYINQELHKQVQDDIISEHYKDFISNLITATKKWNNEVVKKLLINSGIDENNDLAYLSYMQHFGVPTPFLDYTSNPYVALFFAIDGINFTPSDNEIDNYFSLYYTYKMNTAFITWQMVFDKNIKEKDISYESIDLNCMSIILPETEFYKIFNSANIINQEGLFLFNNHPWYPLERTYKEDVEHTKSSLGEDKFKELMILDTVSGCINIHKSLIPAIRLKLNEMGITANYIYPDMVNFKHTIINDGILKSLS